MLGGSDWAFVSPEQAALRRCTVYRNSFQMTEIALPAAILEIRLVWEWVRAQGLAIDVRTGEQLAMALAAGIQPSRLSVHAEAMSERELRATAHLQPGRLIVSTEEQIELLISAVTGWMPSVVLRLTNADTAETDGLIRLILDGRRLNLVGLHGEADIEGADFDSCSDAIDEMVVEMELIRRNHGIVLTRLCLGGGSCLPSGYWAAELPALVDEIDESLGDACAALRFPRPLVVLAPGEAIAGQIAQ